jgi:hypothetical protein
MGLCISNLHSIHLFMLDTVQRISKMARQDTDLPYGDSFGPGQLTTEDDESNELVVILELIDKYSGNSDEFDQIIADRFFESSTDPLKRARNVRFGLGDAGYNLIGDDFQFTEIGKRFYNLRDEPEKMYDRFAQYILHDLHGLKVIEIIEDLETQGKSTTNANIKQELRDQYGFHIDKTSNHWSQMRGWLSKAGIVNTGVASYDIDRSKIEELVGISSEDIIDLDDLTTGQRAFLRALALIDPDEEMPNSIVRKVAEKAYDVDISQSNISKKTLDPLQEAGYIEWRHRNGKPNLVKSTNKFDSEVLIPILDDVSERVGVPRHVIRSSFTELEEQMDSESTHERGIALETLAIKIGRLLGLDFVGWRVRGKQTNGAEVDVVFDEVGKTFNRWQIQCKNTKSTLESKYVAREVGITRTLQTNTILMITRGGTSQDARQFASQVMRHENLAIIFLSEDDLLKLDEQPDHLLTTLRGESRRVQRIKCLQMQDSSDESKETEIQEEEALAKYEDEISEYQSAGPEMMSLSDFNDNI